MLCKEGRGARPALAGSVCIRFHGSCAPTDLELAPAEGQGHRPCCPRARVAKVTEQVTASPVQGPAAPASPAGPLADDRPGAARLPPCDSAPLPSAARLLDPAHCAGLLLTSVRALLLHLPGMRGAGAPGGRGQHSSGMGSPGRPQVIILTYVLVALELTCLFMRFSIMPVSTLPRAAGHPRAPSSLSPSTCATAGAGSGGPGLSRSLPGEPGGCTSWALHQRFLRSGAGQPQGGATESHPHGHAALVGTAPLPLAGLTLSLQPCPGRCPIDPLRLHGSRPSWAQASPLGFQQGTLPPNTCPDPGTSSLPPRSCWVSPPVGCPRPTSCPQY